MGKLTIKAGRSIKFIGTIPNEPIKILKAGTSKAVPESRFKIYQGIKTS